MEQISLPTTITVRENEAEARQGTLTIEPLYPGYGPTVANALRRVLLSSLPGAAIFAFKMKGVKHEFSTLPYIKEDVVDISLNLKRINLRCFSENPVKLELEVKGAKVVTAGDIGKNSDVEIVNPEAPILTLTDKAASVEMTLWVKRGRGYEPVEARSGEELEVNAIAIDAIYTPVSQVGYQVENVRVGGRTDYDKISMQIETNGTIAVGAAVQAVATILADHFALIASTVGSEAAAREEEEEDETV